METGEIALRIYRLLNAEDEKVELDLKRLAEFIKTRSQIVDDIEYLTVSKISKSGVVGLVIIRGEKSRVENEVALIHTFIKSDLKSLDVDTYSRDDVFTSVLRTIKNFL